MNRRQFASIAAAAALTFGLSACGGGGDSGPVVTPPTPPATKNVSVTPGLGAFGAGARVTAYKMDGVIIDTKVTDAAGKAEINFGDYNGPFVLRVNGGPTVTYYDEKLGTDVNFPTTASLLAIVPKASVAAGEQFGVTPLTHLVAAALGVDPSKPISASNTVSGATSADIVAKIEGGADVVYALLGLSRTDLDIFAAPTLVSSTSTSVSASTQAGLYGLLLAELAAKSSTNALDQLGSLFTQVASISAEIAKGESADLTKLTEALSSVLATFSSVTNAIATGTSSFAVAGSVPDAVKATFTAAATTAAEVVAEQVSESTGTVIVIAPGGEVTIPVQGPGSGSGSGSGTGSGDGGG